MCWIHKWRVDFKSEFFGDKLATCVKCHKHIYRFLYENPLTNLHVRERRLTCKEYEEIMKKLIKDDEEERIKIKKVSERYSKAKKCRW